MVKNDGGRRARGAEEGRGENGQGGNVWGKEVKRSGRREAPETTGEFYRLGVGAAC